MKGESPGLSIGDVAKRLGEMWNGTSGEDKQPYEKKAAKLKEKYEKVKKTVAEAVRAVNGWLCVWGFALTCFRSSSFAGRCSISC